MRRWLNLPWIAVIMGPILMIAPILFTGNAVYWGTPFLQFVPWRVFAVRSLLEGQLPYWNSNLGMGAPLIANYQSALFYPPNWILLLLQAIGGVEWQTWGQSVLILLHWIFAGVGTVLLLRKLGVGTTGQTVGALAFALSGYLVGRASFLSMNAATAWLPWVTLAVESLAGMQHPSQAASRRWLKLCLPLALTVAMLLLTGHAQLAWYILIFTFAWGFYRSYVLGGLKHTFRVIAGYIASGIFATAVAAVQLVPTLEYLHLTARATSLDFAYTVNYSFWPWRLLTFLAPDLFGNPASADYWLKTYIYEEAVYIGLLPLLLSGIAIFLSFKRNFNKTSPIVSGNLKGLNRFLLAFTVVSMILAMGQFLPVFPFFYKFIPTFNMFQAPARFSLLAVFSLALLAGQGADYLRRPVGKALYWARLMTAGSAAIGIGAGLAWLFLGEVRPTFIRAAAMTGLWLVGSGILILNNPDSGEDTKSNRWNFALTAWIIMDLCIAGWSLNPSVPLNFYRDASKTSASLSGLAGGHRVYMPGALEEHLKFDQYFRVNVFPDEARVNELASSALPNTNLLADNLASVNNFDPLTTARYQIWLEKLESLSNSRAFAWLPWMDISLVASDVGSNNHIEWKPVAGAVHYRMASCLQAVKSEDEALTAIFQRGPGTSGPRETQLPVVLEGWVGEPDTDCRTSVGSIHELKRTTNDHILEISAGERLWLVESETWYPGWTAELDGKQVPLYRADYLFRAVEIPAGDHTLRLTYRPSYATLSMLSTLLVSLVIIIVYVILSRQAQV